MFAYFCATTIFLVRFFRIHPVRGKRWHLIFGAFLNMIAIWGNKEHLTCVFPLWFSHDGPKSLKRPKPSKIPSLRYSACFSIFGFVCFCATTIFLVRCLRIHPVQTVVNNPTQLSGRGIRYIFYMQIFLSQLYALWYSKMEVGPCNLENTNVALEF